MTTNNPEETMINAAERLSKRVRAAMGDHNNDDLPVTQCVINMRKDIVSLQAECEALRAKTRMSLGVGDGAGDLFVHGDYDSIKRVQALVFENEKLRKDAERYRYIKKGNQWVVAATQTGFQLDGEELDDLVDSEKEEQK